MGNISTESRYWGYPEAFTGARPSYYVNTSSGSADLTGSMAAAFAASSLALKAADPPYAQVRTAMALLRCLPGHCCPRRPLDDWIRILPRIQPAACAS